MVSKKEIEKIKKYIRAADYLTVIQIYLLRNFFLEKPLSFDDVKPRLLGHWGTCPGINFIYGHLNYFIKKTKVNIAFVLGPGHGFPALQANLFLEESLSHYYPEVTFDKKGIATLARLFSWPYGFSSHSSPITPGVFLEGGELGYSLSTSFGMIINNPDLIVACVIGDGEAETAPLAGSWHLNKLINPQKDGFVLPILHLNEYKISGPTIFGRMKEKELKYLFWGYGYEPIFVSEPNIHRKMQTALIKVFKEIKKLKKRKSFSRWPMIILKTPKGWGGVKKVYQQKIEGNYLSHQVPLSNCKKDIFELNLLEKWLKSYKFNEIFVNDSFDKDILDIIPNDKLKMGRKNFEPLTLKLPREEKLLVPLIGEVKASSARFLGKYLSLAMKQNKTLCLFSPDETYSNKLDDVFLVTKRVFQLPLKKEDKDMAKKGQVFEILSEHNLQGLLQGYALSGRFGIFATYEAFSPIISSMLDQYIKFIRIAQQVSWRYPIPALNYILTSPGWRQEHNGFSHQNPAFIDNLLQKHFCKIRVFFPPDANTSILCLIESLSSYDSVNVIVCGKTEEPIYLNSELAKKAVQEKIMIWDWLSDENPDLVLASAGDYVTKEMIKAREIIKKEIPEIKVRYVNILELSSSEGICSVQNLYFYFTEDKPVIINFHGYPETLKQILFDYKNSQRFFINGYIERGSTTTPFDMHVRNRTSRYHVAIQAFCLLEKNGLLKKEKVNELIKKYEEKIKNHKDYIIKEGIDPSDL